MVSVRIKYSKKTYIFQHKDSKDCFEVKARQFPLTDEWDGLHRALDKNLKPLQRFGFDHDCLCCFKSEPELIAAYELQYNKIK